MDELIGVGLFLAAIVGGLLALAAGVSESLVRSKARRLPHRLSERMHEEWLAELGALPGRPSQLAFAIALTLTRRHSFAIEEESLPAAPARSPITLATFGGWRTVVVFTTVVMAALAYAASFLIQPLYQSHARVLAMPPRMPSQFVEAPVRITLDERFRTLSQLVLSHQRLEDLILEFDLYRSERGLPRPGDAVLDRMRKDISVDVHEDSQSFEVAYVSPDPRAAMMVTERLTALFFREHLRDREDTTHAASAFPDAQIKDVRARLLNLTRANPSEADSRALEHEILRTTYRDLLMKKEQVIMSENVERRQIGEQFRVLVSARLPEAPISPDRPRLTLLGAVAGFCLGVAMMLAGRNGPLRRQKKVLAQS